MSAAFQTLVVILLPIAIPFFKRQWIALGRYKSAVSRPYTDGERWRLLAMAVGAVFYLGLIIRNLFTTETNVYKLTGSRLAIAPDVLQRRLEALGTGMPPEFWSMLESRENVLMYLRLGSAPMLHCQWCDVDNPNTFVYYLLGGLAVRYVGHLWLLSCCTDFKALSAFTVLASLCLEVYIRAGGLDRFNNRTKTADDIIFIDSYAALSRQCFFLWTLAACSIKCFLDARFPGPVANLNTVRHDLIQSIERLRASNSMQRAIGDTGPLRTHSANFWARNEEATTNLDRNPALQEARLGAATRFGDTSRELAQAREFVQRTASLGYSSPSPLSDA